MVLWQQIFFDFGTDDFPFKIPFKKCFKIDYFLAPASRSGFGAAISDAVARNSIAFCTTGSADRTVMAVLRFLAASPACAILVSFAADGRRSHWSGCIKVPMVMWQLLFSILALVLFCCDTSVCKSFSVLKFLCAKASVCKKFSCVKASVCVKGLVCKSFCV